MLNLNSFYLRKDTTSATYSYYGYNLNLNASDTDNNWLIRQVSVISNIETTKWSSNDLSQYYSVWNNRTSYFSQPLAPSLTYSLVTPNGVRVSWVGVTGVSVYNYSIKDMNGNNITYLLDAGLNTYSSINPQLINQTSFSVYNLKSGNTYSISVTSVNTYGSATSSLTLTT